MNALAGVQVGRTRLLTRFEVASRAAAGVLGLLGALVAFIIGAAVVALVTGAERILPSVSTRPIKAGDGPLIDPAGASTSHLQFPVDVTWPVVDPLWLAVLIAAVLTAAWLRYIVVPMARRVTGENLRHRGLATPRAIRKAYGRRALRRSGWKFALPGSTRRRRFLVSTKAMGIHFGKSLTPAAGGELWCNLEQRIRIIARPGWGKTTRLLVPIVRQLHGPAMISSTEPEIFTSTVLARATRRVPGRFGYRHPRWEYPIAVIDCSPGRRITGGKYPTARWNPLPGCEDFSVATRRAEALMKGVDTAGQTQDSAAAKYFEEVASAVVAAAFHAAALEPDIDIAAIAGWIAESDYSTADRILESHASDDPEATSGSDPVALLGIRKFLDKVGGRTTVQVEASVLKGISSILSSEGRSICGSRSEPQFDMVDLIRERGTLYLLAEPDRMRVVRPLLSMIAAEMFIAAEDVARTSHGRSPAFYAVLDELRSGVRTATLPDIASEKRKFRIGYVYACTNGGDEEALYGEADALRLQAAAGTSIYGGLDAQSAEDITGRTGQTTVVQASRGGIAGTRQESLQRLDTLTMDDMQQLDDGQSVIVGRNLRPFLAVSEGVHEIRRLNRRIAREGRTLHGLPRPAERFDQVPPEMEPPLDEDERLEAAYRTREAWMAAEGLLDPPAPPWEARAATETNRTTR